jgi:asparaginyl-tRNA synthetase
LKIEKKITIQIQIEIIYKLYKQTKSYTNHNPEMSQEISKTALKKAAKLAKYAFEKASKQEEKKILAGVQEEEEKKTTAPSPPIHVSTHVEAILDAQGAEYLKFDFKKSEQLIGQKVAVVGFADRVKVQGGLVFIDLRWADKKIQIIVPSSKSKHFKLPEESFIQVTGYVQEIPTSATSFLSVEIALDKLSILSIADGDYKERCPKQSASDLKLAQRHLALRDETFATITRCRAKLLKAIRQHFDDTDCLEIVPPCLLLTEAEGGATLFKLEHPGKSSDKPMTAFLTQSSQFALEMALPALGDCFCIAPSFRAEHSHTRRHLTEFTHGEAEWGSILSFDQHLQKLRELMQGVVKHFLSFAESELLKLKLYDHVLEIQKLTQDILVLEHKDAIKMCKEFEIYKDEETKEHFGERDDIPECQERQLIDRIGKIVFLTKFPKEFKSFYMALDPEDPSRVLGCDVEAPGVGEIIGSGCRVSDRAELEQRLEEAKLKPEDYSEYIDLRRYGSAQTSGMGLGVDRLLTWLLKAHSIRDVVTFPRFPGYLRP